MAAKRWLKHQAGQFKPYSATLLGDDLYSNQPLCQLILEQKFNFILVCKPESHQILYEWLDSLAASDDIDQVTLRRWNGRFTEIITCRFVEEVPLRGGEAALLVNPRDPSSIASAIKQLHDDKALRQKLIQKGRTRAEHWTAKDFVRGVFIALDEFETVRRCWE